MKKTSGRDSGKQLNANQDKAPDFVTGAENEHNTPPPLLFMQGSLLIEVDTDKLSTTFDQDLTTHKLNPRVTPKNDIFFAHIKILDGSGDMLFRLDTEETDKKRNTVAVAFALEKSAGVLELATVKKAIHVSIPNTKKVSKKSGDKPMSKHRERWRYMEKSTTDEFEIVTIKVTKAGDLVYNVVLKDLPSKGEELKVMAWWEEGT